MSEVRPRYTVDTNVLLEMRPDRRYPRDLFPSLWTGFERLIEAGLLVATEEVWLELKQKDDDISAWAKDRRAMFLPVDEAHQTELIRLQEVMHARRVRLVDPRSRKSQADPWVVAHGMSLGVTVISGETGSSLNAETIKVPDACRLVGVPCLDLLGLVRHEGWRF